VDNLKCITSRNVKLFANLNQAKIKRQPLDFETFSFCGIIKNYYSLSPAMVDRLIWIVKKIKDDYHILSAGISYECIVIGAALFVMRESKLPCYDNVNTAELAANLWKPEYQERNIIQIYIMRQTIEDLFSEIDPYVTQDEESNTPIWKS
jgi:hypothetical protein